MKFIITTFGCRLNQAESQELAKILQNKGWQQAPRIEQADLVVLNSCVVTIKAEKEVRQAIRSFKKVNPKAKIVVAGCWVDKINNFSGIIPGGIDLMVENEAKWQKGLRQIEKLFKLDDLSNQAKQDDRHRLLVKIQSGCENFCTYCLPALIRGQPKSVPATKIIKTINSAVSNKTLEIVLTGQNISAYNDNGKNWLDLIEKILDKTNIKLIRFGSINPFLVESADNDFAAAKKSAKRLVLLYQGLGKNRLARHLHLSLQSGSDLVLEKMNRRYSIDQYQQIIRILRYGIKNLNLTTDIIVGFPSETEENFNQTLNFIKKVKFGKVHIFRYARRPGTLAAKMEKEWGQVSEKIKGGRAKQLKKLEEQSRFQFYQNQIGKKAMAIIWPNGQGLSGNYIPIIINKLEFDRLPAIAKVKFKKFKKSRLLVEKV